MSALFGNIFRRQFWTSRVADSYKCPSPSHGSTPPQHQGGYKFYKRLFLFLGLPVILSLTAILHIQKKACPEERVPFVKYEYLRLRSKPFPWKDGNKSLFHNPKVNALPDGYEEIDENCE